jgi:hypothetical protein
MMKNIMFDAGHIFHHYLECSIPEDEWRRMTVEQALWIARDIADLINGKMSPGEFGEKYALPRT